MNKILKIGKKEIDYSWISVGRTLQATDIYNSIYTGDKVKGNSKTVKIIIDAVIILIRVDFSLSLNWLNRRLITRRFILRHLNYTDLSAFLEIALEPILGDKKKELKAKQQIEEIAEKLLEKMSPEELAKLLQSVAVSTDGQKTIFTPDSAQAS